VNRALVTLTGGALLVLLLRLGQAHHAALAVVAGAVFATVAVVVFPLVERRGRAAAAGYFVVQLPLGYLQFGAAGGAVGAQLLLIVLVIQAVLVLPSAGAAAVTLAVPLAHVGMGWSQGLREGISTFVAVLFAAVLTTLHVRERRARTQLADANERLRRYAAQAEELAASRERNRVARDIHDGLGHHLTVVQMQLQAARAVLDADRARAGALLAKAEEQAREALADVRRSVAALREPRDCAPLPDALRKLAGEAADAGVATAVEVRGARRALPPAAEESLYRVAQEGLTNVRKHALAGSARVLLDYGRADAVRLEVRDDGRGAAGDPDAARGFGLTGLRERVAELGGTLTVDTAPGRGLTLSVELPG
jgi:signal transduction histidine kinase